MTPRILLLGAHRNSGFEILKALAERLPGLPGPPPEVLALAEGRAAHGQVSFGPDRVLRLQDLDRFVFGPGDIAISALASPTAAGQVTRAASEGAMVIDLSRHFRMEAEVPLLVPEVNLAALPHAARRRILSIPSPVSTMLALALKPLLAVAKPRRLVVVTQQATSGIGKEAMDELFVQTRATFVNDPAVPEHFPKAIAFNVIPQIDRIGPDGITAEEAGIGQELRKVLDPDLQVSATCIRVPVFLGVAAAVHAEFHQPLTAAAARAAWGADPNLSIYDRRDDGGYLTPLEVAGEDQVYLSRIRQDPTVRHGLAFWCVSDDLRRGAGLAVAGVVEALLRQGLPLPAWRSPAEG